MTGTPDTDLVFINEEFHAEAVTPAQVDLLLADGWRHFGTNFFRYSLGVYRDEIRRVMPLRIRVADFALSKSQRRVLRKNQDLQVEIRPIAITAESEELFHRHKERFDHGIPASIFEFISREPATVPCEALEIAVHHEGKLIASSFFDVGATSISSIYGTFDPTETNRSLGIFTILKEIEFALENGKEYYYPGYAYEGESFYDYKKRFAATEAFDWNGNWTPLS
ncbi:MAG TPA: hypothetical protein VHQ01_05575 [Pyrinomonadaceae bacterium]|nr:hypothetical protein [Pyrinomonadaceae bacterium]